MSPKKVQTSRYSKCMIQDFGCDALVGLCRHLQDKVKSSPLYVRWNICPRPIVGVMFTNSATKKNWCTTIHHPINPHSGWWFGTFFFIFPCIGNNHPNWLSYFSEGLKPPASINSQSWMSTPKRFGGGDGTIEILFSTAWLINRKFCQFNNQ